jgi:AraC-like DNA-binding protein
MRHVRAATSVDDVLADPVGAYFAGASFLVWFQPDLAGAFAFGRLAPSDYPLVQRLLVTPSLPRGYDLLCDTSAIEVFDERAFELLATILQLKGAELLGGIRRLALIRPAGLVGATIAGLFYERVLPHVDAALFADRAEALDWLGYAPNARTRTEIDDVIHAFYAVPQVLRDLRALLVQHVADATLASAAQALGRSERSLQRELARANTSFRAELTRARIRVAESLLASSDDKVETIAHQLGFASLPAFTTLFGEVVGESPGEFRKRRRNAPCADG